jgi:ribose transport system ATP-binding protein
VSLLQLQAISRRYPGVTALDSVDFTLQPGAVHALVGENGAGKSTLLRVLAGAERPDEGRVLLDGTAVTLASPRDALDRGITVIYQELALVPELAADANVFLGMEPARWGVLDRTAMRARARETLEALGLSLPDPGIPVRRLSIAQRQLVELARALVRRARVIALDEPTATLSPAEVAHLFARVDGLRREGAAIAFVSHRLDEVRRLADEITVLRDGRVTWHGPAAEVSDAELIRRMVGRDVAYARQPPAAPPAPDPFLDVRGLSRAPGFRDVSFAVRRGEILGIAGLVGAGRTEVGRCLAGIDPWLEGEATLGGRPYRPRSPQDGIAHGVVYLPEDRKRDGLVLGFPVGSNVTLAALRRFTPAGVLRRGPERAAAQAAVDGVGLRPPALDRATRTLSGGNQQKVVLAKWLLAAADVLIFDEPTRGVDVGAKADLHRQIRGLADQGKTVIVISSELPEVLALADRVLVMREGRAAGELDARDATAERIMGLAVGA